MQMGLIGLGRMGRNMRERVRAAGHEVVGFDSDPSVRDVGSLVELISRLSRPRVVWVMVPAGEPTRTVIEELSELLAGGDLVIEGGNSHFSDDEE
ncbi:MAG: 6-phosphogluconate dehydrogenase, partial [Comamonadaceae bacterium]